MCNAFRPAALLLTLALGTSSPAWSQAAPDSAKPRGAEAHNLVQLSASGTAEGPQDLLTMTLFTTREADSASEVQATLSKTVEAALADLRKSAQPGAMEVRTGNFSVQPRFGKDGKIKDWAGSAELVLEGSDFARIGNAAARARGLVVSGLYFGLSRAAQAQLEALALERAMVNFKARTMAVVQGFGFSGFALRDIQVNVGDSLVPPRPYAMADAAPMAMAAVRSVPLEAGKSSVNASVLGTVQLK